jgi:two-component system, chemotaxis family, CheB/CheR fusion protein
MARKKKTASSAPISSTDITNAKDKRPPFPIVGIGASAGGLEALQAFFDAMPPASGIAFVVVTHLDPIHISLLPELLQKHTKMQVFQVEDGIFVQPNTVHIIPPNKELKLSNGRLRLSELRQPRGANLPIDSFFRSLAQDQGAHAACIILSGTGTDGTLGLKAIKGELGLVIVQDEESAHYDGMPRSAIATGLVDYTLPPGEMPAALISYMQHARAGTGQQKTSNQPTAAILGEVYSLLRGHTRHDFSLYKENTIIRRIERRMAVHQLVDAAAYARYLQENAGEIDILFKELLIGVTSFFRDPQAFAALRGLLIDYLKDKERDYNFRVWVPGCSTGEEAYSIAILLQECMQELKSYFNVQIFGTDIYEMAIHAARRGVYPLSIAGDLGEQRLASFFRREEQGYQINKAIREMLVFAPQDLIQDPPFTKLDLLSCRNLLIYFSTDLQKRLLPIFHYSLKENGTLFLGTSETTGAASDLFASKDTKAKLFASNPLALPIYKTTDFPIAERRQRVAGTAPTNQQYQDLNAIRLIETILQQSDTPPCVLVDSDNNILYVHGRTGRFLEPAIGRANAQILQMARPGLRGALATAIREAHISRKKVVCEKLRVEQDSTDSLVNITVNPLLEQPPLHDVLLVSFEVIDTPEQQQDKKSPSAKRAAAKSAAELEQELHSTRDQLQSTIEELESSNEELKSSNEELQSTNEELQSTNEELETSKEELQSLNEESTTVNAELQSHIDELTRTHDDMENLLNSTRIATLFLDVDLCIHRFTPQMTQTIALTEGDIGRPITDLAVDLQDVDLNTIARQVLDTLTPQKMEVSSATDRFFSLRISPYRTLNNVIDGVVITLDNITQLKELENKLRFSEERYRLVLESSSLVVAHIDRELRYTWIHNTHADFDQTDYLGKRDDEIANDEGTRQLVQLKEQVLKTGVGASAEISFPLSGGKRTYNINAAPLRDATGAIVGITTVSLDISEHKETKNNAE